MRLQSAHKTADRGLDAYFTPPEAVASLLALERHALPGCVWEPAAGDGAIVRPLRAAGYTVLATDLVDYGLEGCHHGVDYLAAQPIVPVGHPMIDGIVTNPPFRLAQAFAEKAVAEVPYVALLLRTNFLESVGRLSFFRRTPPARIWISARRLPMMHRHGWTGPRAASNTAFAWFTWDANAERRTVVGWFDWREHVTDVRREAA